MVYEDSGHSPHAPACRLCRERSSTLDLSSPPDTCGSLSTSSQHSRRTPLLGSIPRGLRSSSRGHRPLTLIVPACWCAGSNGGVCAVAFEAFQPPQEGCLFPLRTSSIRAHRKAPPPQSCMRSARSWIRGGLIGCSLSPQRFAVVRDGGSVQVANLRDEVVEGGHLHEVTDFLMYVEPDTPWCSLK